MLTNDGKNSIFWMTLLLLLLALLAWYLSYRANTTLFMRADSASLQQRYETLQQEAGVMKMNLLRTLHVSMKGVSGDLVWSSAKQVGILHISGLPKPESGNMYRIWVFDAKSGVGLPVVLGIIQSADIARETYVPLQTEQNVKDPYKFVVESMREGDPTSGQVLLSAQP